ncbi:hypothetical protein VDQ94_02285 [Xanthomonas campestris pv. campestris]|uniref:hypothetical protein n=1 Tax=Xanthomonas campestris TaxID=339 RepID=UPI001E3A06B9|nr:hypothetical protein [Xanthomonas campestris]MCC5067954.1 hypothetical protein [Xanthomonas campestris]MEB1547740.1 hypothetical protein [Xanthomonas campestris pv. campestris]MEB1552505.1 hypothetical protein [Xanthomonas campestris pv. campestris]
MRVDRRLAIRVAGALLSFSCIAWIVKRFVEQGAFARMLGQNQGRLAMLTGSGALAYAGAVALLAFAWVLVQRAACGSALPMRSLFRVYCISQFAKYLPGNLGHYVGRHVWGRRHGIGHTALLAAGVSEAAVLVFAAIAWSAPLLDGEVLHQWLSPRLGAYWLWLAQASALLAVWLTLGWLPDSLEGIGPLRRMRVQIVARMLPLHLLFFAVLGASLYGPAIVMGAPADIVWILPAAAAISWLAGFLVVGAPAGIGVREVVFVAVLAGRMPEADLLALASVMRVITFGGDFSAFAVATIWRTRNQPNAVC